MDHRVALDVAARLQDAEARTPVLGQPGLLAQQPGRLAVQPTQRVDVRLARAHRAGRRPVVAHHAHVMPLGDLGQRLLVEVDKPHAADPAQAPAADHHQPRGRAVGAADHDEVRVRPRHRLGLLGQRKEQQLRGVADQQELVVLVALGQVVQQAAGAAELGGVLLDADHQPLVGPPHGTQAGHAVDHDPDRQVLDAEGLGVADQLVQPAAQDIAPAADRQLEAAPARRFAQPAGPDRPGQQHRRGHAGARSRGGVIRGVRRD